MKIKSLSFIFILVLFSASWALYSQPAPNHHFFPINQLDIMQKELNLTEVQIKKINFIIESYRLQHERSLIALERIQLDIREELLKERPEIPKLEKIIKNKSQLLAEMELNNLKKMIEIKSLLTSEQLKKLEKMQWKKPHDNMKRNSHQKHEQKHDMKKIR